MRCNCLLAFYRPHLRDQEYQELRAKLREGRASLHTEIGGDAPEGKKQKAGAGTLLP